MPPRRSVGRRPAPGSPRSGLSQATSRARRAPRHISWPIWAGIGALVAYGWWFINRQPFSGGALLALFGAAAADWRCSGVDPEGMDLRSENGGALRVDFPQRVVTPDALRRSLKDLADHARAFSGKPN